MIEVMRVLAHVFGGVGQRWLAQEGGVLVCLKARAHPVAGRGASNIAMRCIGGMAEEALRPHHLVAKHPYR